MAGDLLALSGAFGALGGMSAVVRILARRSGSHLEAAVATGLSLSLLSFAVGFAAAAYLVSRAAA